MPGPIQAVLFDFDGTLVDSEPLHYDCWMQAVRPFGGGMDWGRYTQRLTGRTDLEAGRILLSEAGHEPTEELIREVLQVKRTAFHDRFCDELSIQSEIIDWIDETVTYLSLAVVSSSLRSEVEPLLVQAGILSSLDAVVCGDDVHRHKPDPEPYLLALERLTGRGKAIHPQNCLVFEDSAAGVAAARAAGMTVFQVSTPDELLPLLRKKVPLRDS